MTAGVFQNAAPLASKTHSRILFSALGLGHLLFVSRRGLKPEYLIIDGLVVTLPWLGTHAFEFLKLAFPLWLTGVVVDAQRYLPLLGSIHTGDIWRWEVRLFPAAGPSLLSWPEWLNSHFSSGLDLITGFAYAGYLWEFFAVAVFFYVISERVRFLSLGWAFFVSNTLGALIYVFFPVAPPWYIIEHGLGPANPLAAPGAGGCARFDALLGIHYFSSFYSRNPNVFGAMPSLHVAYPLMVSLFTWERGWKWRVPTLLFTLLVCFSAVYLAHHYILDVLAGLFVAVISYHLGKTISHERTTTSN